jgi:hypothetical protein
MHSTTRVLPALGALVALAFLPLAHAQQAAPATVKGIGSVEVPGPVGRVKPIHSSGDKDYPAPDVVKLSLQSDGTEITVGATLRDEPGAFATSVVTLYLDTDNKTQTGGNDKFKGLAGFEFRSELDSCVDYADHSSACAGGSDAKPTAHWAAAGLERVKGQTNYGTADYDEVVSPMGFPGKLKASRAPVTAKKLEGKLAYANLGVKPGQVLRILVREEHKDPGAFPEILLTLK